jgi:hypothetical protein
MAAKRNSIINLVKEYIQELKNNNIPIKKAILFGSYSKGDFNKNSDIDVALISSSFTGDRFQDRRKIVPLRRNIDSRIEPIPFTPGAFIKGGNLIDEIKKTGTAIV